jgi:hypothetical protein
MVVIDSYAVPRIRRTPENHDDLAANRSATAICGESRGQQAAESEGRIVVAPLHQFTLHCP